MAKGTEPNNAADGKMSFDYPRKVRFKCLLCGICCGDTKTKTRHILLTEQEANLIGAETNQPIAAFAHEAKDKTIYRYEMRKTVNTGKCFFLKENCCIIYSKRPLICRFYPFGLETDENERKVFYFTNECPGINKGKKLTKTDFEAMLKKAARRLNKNSKNELQA